jgi:hypothetical protein
MSIEIPEVGDVRTKLENGSERVMRRLAIRVSRRSFLGTLGRGAVVATIGGVASSVILEGEAQAHSCGCSGCSVHCQTLTGNNRCPNNTSVCGCWCIADSGCANYKEWCDCCGDTYCQNHPRQCINGNPSCCNHRFYSTTSDVHIACRRYRCVSLSKCDRVENPC